MVYSSRISKKNWDIEAVDFYNMLNKALVDYVQTPFLLK